MVPKALVTSTQWLASTLASFWAFLTHSLATKTCWATYIKMTKEYHVKKKKKRTQWLTYHGKVHFQGHKEVRLLHVPESLHIFGHEEGLL